MMHTENRNYQNELEKIKGRRLRRVNFPFAISFMANLVLSY